MTISSISCLVIYPSPSKSYIVKAHFSFCSNLPRDVTESAQRNSRKSIEPSPFASKVRNTCSANFDASPYGKKLPYIFLNSSTLKVLEYLPHFKFNVVEKKFDYIYIMKMYELLIK